jgi:triosephosphate isomerase
MNGENLTQQILSSKNSTMLMVVRKNKEIDPELLKTGMEIGRFCKNNSIDFYKLTSSSEDGVTYLDEDSGICYADETVLKTMVRSNPGYLLLKEGTILHKWSWANLPDTAEILKIITITNQNN